MPKNTVYVGRPTKWGNPYAVGERYRAREVTGPFNGGMLTMGLNLTIKDREQAVRLFRQLCQQTGPESTFDIARVKIELRGKNLACWCPLNQPCHADILLELVNQ